jgi:hypothetical protein
MPSFAVTNVGQFGVNKDANVHALPPEWWTDAGNIRFANGMAAQFLGHQSVYGTPSVVPYHIIPMVDAGDEQWLYLGAAKAYYVTGTTHTNITRQTAAVDVDYTGSRNGWTSTIFGGFPVFTNGVDTPQYYPLSGKCEEVPAWPSGYTCEVIRSFNNFLIALGISKSGIPYPHLILWSTRADPGSMPSTWNIADTTQDAGEQNINQGQDPIVDAMALRDTFLIYKRNSVWRLDEVGGPYVFKLAKVLGTSGALNKNCIEEIDGQHFVLTNEDVIIHDGFQSKSVMNKQTRLDLFTSLDVTYYTRAFVGKNPFYNEMWVCYPTSGNQIPNKAMVWTWEDNTVSFRDIPNVNHMACGPVTLSTETDTWASAVGTWATETSTWSSNASTLDSTRAMLASNDTEFFVVDESATFDGTAIEAFLERRCIPVPGTPDRRVLITGIMPVIEGTDGGTVTVKVGYAESEDDDPTYTSNTFTIGSGVRVFCEVNARYPAIRFETGTASAWKLKKYIVYFEDAGEW